MSNPISQGPPPMGGQPGQYPPPFPQYPPQAPPAKSEPKTLPGWGIIPVAVGTVVTIIGMFALNWLPGMSLSELAEGYGRALDDGRIPKAFTRQVLRLFFELLIYVLVAGQVAYMVGWVAGGVRGRKSAKLILSVPAKSVAEGRLGPMRAWMAGSSAFLTFLPGLAAWKVLGGTVEPLEAGGWTTLGGLTLITIGAAIGPRLPRTTPSQPPPYGGPMGGPGYFQPR